jgi:predicted RNase H-like HicB family nuclease
MGVSVRLRVHIRHDLEANVYVAESPDLEGLIVEAHTLDEVKDESLAAAAALLELKLHSKPQAQTDFIWHSAVPA